MPSFAWKLGAIGKRQETIAALIRARLAAIAASSHVVRFRVCLSVLLIRINRCDDVQRRLIAIKRMRTACQCGPYLAKQ